MDMFFESGLFPELGEVVGCDPELYEDTQKQLDFSTPFLTNEYACHMDGSISALENSYVSSGSFQTGELDSLLAENTQLIDQLMSANGFELPNDIPDDLADIDEVAAKLDSFEHNIPPMEEHEDLLADLERFASSPVNYPNAVSPASSISTLPSEPSSPVDLLPFLLPEYQKEQSPAGELSDLLQSLLDDNNNSQLLVAPDTTSTALYDSVDSPLSDLSYSTSQSTADDSWNDDSSSIYSSDTFGETESFSGKTKPKKKSKSTPYSKLPAGRKAKKKQQNKEAAIRYREKKRKEAQTAMGEEEEVAKKNNLLKTEVLNLEREIMCMKELLSDVFNIHSL